MIGADAIGMARPEQPLAPPAPLAYPEAMIDPLIAEELDTCGLLCPLPVLKARKRLAGMAPGALLRVVADDPAARIDFPHFCAEQGHDLVMAEEEPGQLAFVIRKKRPG